jgi:O-antigen ligase
VAFTLLAMAITWVMPKKFRLVALTAAPLMLALTLFYSSNLIQARVSIIADEVKAYSLKSETGSSSGWRLNSWTRSISAIAEQPLRGHGVGGWTATVKRLQGPAAVEVFGDSPASNPHQEYLLWGVELGVGGIFLLVAFFASLACDFKKFPVPIYRAGLSAIVALAIACLFNSTIYDGLIGDYFCVLLGLLIALGLRHGREGLNA